MPRTGRDAWAAAKSWIGRDAYHLRCKQFVREAVLAVSPSQSTTAIECWHEARHQHHTQDPEKVSAFVPAFMDTSNPAEHVLFTGPRDRAGHRLAVTTDARDGRIGLVRLADLVHGWGPLLGWTEDFDGQRIWTPHPIISIANVWDAADHDGDEKGDSPLHPGAVGVVERALVAERLLSPRFVNGYFGPRKKRAYKAWQTRAGYPVTGRPTLADLSRLGIRQGFDVR
jgi:peptidoglycan hydrolase-like protein with peptidoglycan-binding domain